MPLPREEIETVIRLGYYDDELTLETGDPKVKRYLEKRGLKPVSTSRVPVKWEEVQVKRGSELVTERTAVEWDDAVWKFTAPADWFKLPRPKKKVSDEQRAAAGERLRKRREDDDSDEDDD